MNNGNVESKELETTKKKQSIQSSTGLIVKGNDDMMALSSASKMSKRKNKIPRGATGIMPGKNDQKHSAKTQIIGFNQHKSNKEKETLQVEEKKNDKAENEQYDVEVTEPPQYQLKELEAMDSATSHPRMRFDAPTTDIDIDHLTPEMDKQRRRESVVLDEDGDEFKEIQKNREERVKIDKLRNKKIDDEEYELDMNDLTALPNLSGLTRLQTDPMMNADDNKIAADQEKK